MSKSEKVILDAPAIVRALNRMAHEILEGTRGHNDLALVGIRTGGVHLAHRLARKIAEIEKVEPKASHVKEPPIGELDITLYRDDLGRRAPTPTQPVIRKTTIPFDVTDRTIVLVDDVLYTGRTIRAALDGLIDLGRPRRIQLAVLIDRGHRELPIRPDYVGKNLPTSRQEEVRVCLEEEGQEDRVVIRGA